jgi:uncharacterized cupin superfamily protein
MRNVKEEAFNQLMDWYDKHLKCHVCGKSASAGTNLYRQNPKGQPGVWACAAHSKPVEDELVRIVANLAATPEKGGAA